MDTMKLEFAYSVKIDIDKMHKLGQTYRGQRNIVQSSGGSFEGPKLRGRVLAGGGDWFLMRPDGVAEGDVRDTYETDDGALIYVYYRAIMDLAPATWKRVGQRESVPPSEYYFRATPCFETASEKYAWLNKTVAVARGEFLSSGGLSYDVFFVR